MKTFSGRMRLLAVLVALAAAGARAAPGEAGQRVEVRPLKQSERVAAADALPADSPLAMDPLMRALIIGIAASMLREAAAQPDPVEALGNAVERRVVAALSDPNTMRLVEAALKQAFQEAPPELQEPLEAFASSVLRSMRREMLQDLPRRGY